MMGEKDSKVIPPPPVLPTITPEQTAQMLKEQLYKGGELLKKDFLSAEDIQAWNTITRNILTKAFGQNPDFGQSPDYINLILYAGEKPGPVYEPESFLEKKRRVNFQESLEMLGNCIAYLQGREVPQIKLEKKIEATGGAEGQKAADEKRRKVEKKDPALELRKEMEKLYSRPKVDVLEGLKNERIPMTPSQEEKKKAESPPPPALLKPEAAQEMKKVEESQSRKVFVVHGGEGKEGEAVARFLENLGMEPIFLHEEPNRTINVLEKFESYSDAVFAIFILTGDEYGYPKDRPEELKPRPKQGVIFELGFLLGRLERNLVCALYEEGVELPSDERGLIFIPYDPGGVWKLLTARAMKMTGIDIDLNKAV